MSAIWGYIQLNSKETHVGDRVAEVREKMKKPYENCAIDRFEEKSFDNGFFACGIQYFNRHARNEELPYYDEAKELLFAADVVLNDRARLVKELNDAGFKEVSLDTPDGELSYFAWKKWGCKFTDHLLGLFAIAIFDKKNSTFYLFTDHTGSRCADYSICGDELFFSTLSRPIYDAMPDKYKGFDEQFITGCEASYTPYMYVFPDRTPFKNIHHTVRGSFTKAEVSGNKWKCKSEAYYIPGSDKAVTSADTNKWAGKKWPENPKDIEYRNAFREVFTECVKDAIDTDGEVAATISSGLDSSSVATVAARLLQSEDRKLYGYTSVPMKGFVNKSKGLDIPDESGGVKNIVAGYPNIEQTFCDCEGMSSFTEMDELTRMFEIPGKAFVNQVWIKYIVEEASRKGCKVLLNGQFGNFTISRGSMKVHFFHKLLAGNAGEAKRQLAMFGAKNGVPRKILLKSILHEISAETLFKIGLNRKYEDILDNKYLKTSLMNKYRIKKVLKKRFSYYGFTDVVSVKKMYRNLGDINILQTQGLYDTKYSLYYGVLFRDPTKDKRLMDLVSSFPPEQYVYNGMERRLVREYLDDYIPDYERLQVRYKGRQGADKVLRLKSFGDDHREHELNNRIYDYMERQNVSDLMKKEIDEENVLDIVRMAALSRFFDEFE